MRIWTILSTIIEQIRKHKKPKVDSTLFVGYATKPHVPSNIMLTTLMWKIQIKLMQTYNSN